MAYGTMTEFAFWGGETVVLKHPSGGMTVDDRFTVTKVNPKNLKVKHIKTGKTYQGPHAIWKKVETTEADIAAEKEQIEKNAVDFSQFEQGVVVELAPGVKKPAKWDYPDGQQFVVIKHNFQLVNIVRLGGDKGRYWRMNPNHLVIVDI